MKSNKALKIKENERIPEWETLTTKDNITLAITRSESGAWYYALRNDDDIAGYGRIRKSDDEGPLSTPLLGFFRKLRREDATTKFRLVMDGDNDALGHVMDALHFPFESDRIVISEFIRFRRGHLADLLMIPLRPGTAIMKRVFAVTVTDHTGITFRERDCGVALAVGMVALWEYASSSWHNFSVPQGMRDELWVRREAIKQGRPYYATRKW